MKNRNQGDIEILRHILKYCDTIEALISRFGKKFDVFHSDIAYRDAVSMNILQIGELSGRLSEGFRMETQEIMPWKAMKNMRNFFAHNYGNMDVRMIWATALENIPDVKSFCEEMIKDSNDADAFFEEDGETDIIL